MIKIGYSNEGHKRRGERDAWDNIERRTRDIAERSAQAAGRGAEMAQQGVEIAGESARNLAGDGAEIANRGVKFAEENARDLAENGARIVKRGAKIAERGVEFAEESARNLTENSAKFAEQGAKIIERGAEIAGRAGDFLPGKGPHHREAFRAHLFGMPVVCMTGRDAAGLFGDQRRFSHGFAPGAAAGEEHAGRAFLEHLSGHQKTLAAELVKRQWEACVPRWKGLEKVVLYDEARYALCRAACQWCCVPVRGGSTKAHADDLSGVLEFLGGGEVANGLAAWQRTERWAAAAVEAARSGKLKPHSESALYRIAFYKQPDGSVPDLQTAASELAAILFSMVAAASPIVFCALALKERPEWREKLRSGGRKEIRRFVQEVRRYYPSLPFLGATVRSNFVWRRCRFPKGAVALLDLYGINHDSHVWAQPEEFRPERFGGRSAGPRGRVIPGGGIAGKAVEASLDFLVNSIDYDTPPQDFSYHTERIPSVPASGFVMTNIRRRADSSEPNSDLPDSSL